MEAAHGLADAGGSARRRVGCAPNGEMSFGAVEVMDFDDFVSGGAVGVLGVVRDHW